MCWFRAFAGGAMLGAILTSLASADPATQWTGAFVGGCAALAVTYAEGPPLIAHIDNDFAQNCTRLNKLHS